jgi:hypothetical protein
MNLPEQPPTFRPPTAAERPWWWRLEDDTGAEVSVAEEYSAQRFVSQADAESWVGETWTELSEVGVASVSLFEGERAVYGPMSLTAG